MKTTILYLYDICGMSANAIAQCLKISIEDVIEVLSEEDLA